MKRIGGYGALAVFAVVLAVGAWAAFLRPVTVKVAQAARDVPVQVFGLGTVEARVSSKVGFKVAGVLVDLRADVEFVVRHGAHEVEWRDGGLRCAGEQPRREAGEDGDRLHDASVSL